MHNTYGIRCMVFRYSISGLFTELIFKFNHLKRKVLSIRINESEDNLANF